jgi:hypothetical protein
VNYWADDLEAAKELTARESSSERRLSSPRPDPGTLARFVPSWWAIWRIRRPEGEPPWPSTPMLTC